MGYKKMFGLSLVFAATIAMFIYFFILNTDFWARITPTGWTILIGILVVLVGGVWVYFNAKR
jgi:hypothetical protein